MYLVVPHIHSLTQLVVGLYWWSLYTPHKPSCKARNFAYHPQWSSFADSLILGSGSQLYNVLNFSWALYLGDQGNTSALKRLRAYKMCTSFPVPLNLFVSKVPTVIEGRYNKNLLERPHTCCWRKLKNFNLHVDICI